MPVIFAHGITVREDGYNELLSKVQSKLQAENSNLRVEGFYWGRLATSPNYQGASTPQSTFLKGLPQLFEGRSAGETDIYNEQMSETMLNTLLLTDPYRELITLKDAEDFDLEEGFMPIPEEVEQRNQILSRKKQAVIEQIRSRPNFANLSSDTIETLVTRAFNEAGRTDRRLKIGDLIEPLTRCLTASFYKEIVNSNSMLNANVSWIDVNEDMKKILEKELAGERGLGDTVGKVALSGVTGILRLGLREQIMKWIYLFIGDVLVYLGQRDKILQELANLVDEAVKKSSDPLWLVGHSLGGIICYDYCCQSPHKVERLVTVGSQVSLFGEFGALKNQFPPVYPIETPGKIGNWLNIYDLNDILSFVAEDIFTRVDDRKVDTKAPFPISHGEYWNIDKVYEVIVQ